MSDDSSRVQFGIFDFTPATGELRRDGSLVRLQAQPAQVLGVLVENAGELVTREALQQAIWGTDTYVDFDRGLNFCIAQIRSALRDSADSPRYIQTLPKRGYKFIAPVTRTAREGIVESKPAPAVTPNRRPLALWLSLALALATGMLFLAIRFWPAHRAAAQPAVTVAVVRFDNQTGNPDLDRFADGLTDSVVAELASSGGERYGVIGNAAILRQPRARRDLIAIGTTLKVGYVILGQVQGSPPHLSVLGSLIRLPEQTHVKVTRPQCTMGEPPCSQPELARRIVADLSSRLLPIEPASPAHRNN